MRRFFAPPSDFNGNQIALSLEESRHLRDVLRLREGDEISVFDGEGNEFLCQITKIGRGKELCLLDIQKKIETFAPESPLDLTLAIALLKGEKIDLVVQKATELGVKRIIPLLTKRTDVKTDANSANKRVERWQKIALEAAKQCGRAFVPKIDFPISFTTVVENFPKSEFGILFSEKNGTNLTVISQEKFVKLTAIVGAEGGWEDAEIEFAMKNNWKIVTLGGRILRAETAGIVTTAILQNIFGDLK